MKKRIKLLITLLFIAIFTTSCIARQIAYMPDPVNIKDPKTIIYRILEEQPGAHTPIEIEVKDDKFRVLTSIRLSAKPFSGGSVLKASVVYYDNIGSIKLYKFRNYYNIFINSESEKLIYRVVTYDLDKAKSFMDALHAMMN